MDLNKLRTAVFEKTGIKIDTSDPIFALVALNEAVLSETVEPHVSAMKQAADELNKQANHLMEAGDRYTKLLQQMAALTESGNAPVLATALTDESKGKSSIGLNGNLAQWTIGAIGIAILSALLTLAGQRTFMARTPAPQAVIMKMPSPAPAPLTPEQILLIQNGEKYAKMWPKLDAKTQDQIQQLIQQP